MTGQDEELGRLRGWLAATGVDVELELLSRAVDSDVDQRHQLILLNDLESRFDDLIAEHLGRPINWAAIRAELGLVPPARNPWTYIGDRARESFAERGYPEEQIQRAERLWGDFLSLEVGQIKPLQAASGWVAALDYLLQNLYFTGSATQNEIGERYNVSASTVGLRFRALVDALGVVLHDHKTRKRLAAARAVTIDAGRMTEAEFNRRLLRGQIRTEDQDQR